jgi:hypothetical protein
METARQVREDKESYIPDFLTDGKYDTNPEGYSAASKHAKHLRKAEGLLDDAYNLVRLLLASLADEGDSRAMQIEAGLKAVEKKLDKAHLQLDKHDTRHTNLYLAYFDLKRKEEESEE